MAVVTPARRVGILGGSFDPVHNAHIALARAALLELRLDELRWTPAGYPWQKSDRGVTAPVHRRSMVRLAIEGERRYVLDTCEMQREGPSYTIDTVREMQAARPRDEILLVIGQDQYARLPSWHEWRELLSRVTLAVAARGDESVRPVGELAAVWHRLEAIDMPASDISSTDIRERVARGESIDGLVPESIARYIAHHKLYRRADPV